MERSGAENPAATVEYSAEDGTDQGTGLKTFKNGAGRRQASVLRRRHSKSASNDLTDDESQVLNDVLSVGVLCNNATLHRDGTAVGDPLVVALLQAGAIAGLHRRTLMEQMPEVREEAFDAATKMMATVHKKGGGHSISR